MRVLAVTAALIGAVWATVSAQSAADRDQFFKAEGRWWTQTRHLETRHGSDPKWNNGAIDTLATWSSLTNCHGTAPARSSATRSETSPPT